MSGSYFVLDSKYNSLLTLALNNNSGGSNNLAQVLAKGNTANNEIILTDGTIQGSLTKTEVTFLNGTNTSMYGQSISITEPNTSVIIDGANGYSYTKDGITCELKESVLNFLGGTGDGYLSQIGLKLFNGTSELLADVDHLSIYDVTHGSSMGKTYFNFDSLNKGMYSLIDALQILSPTKLDLSCVELTLNGIGGNSGDVLISGGVGSPPSFIDVNSLIANGFIINPTTTGSVSFADYGFAFTSSPSVILTVKSGTSTIYLVNIISMSNLGFVYQMSALGAVGLMFIAIGT